MKKVLLLMAFAGLLMQTAVFAQKTDSVKVIVELKDGSQVTGIIVSENENEIVLRTENLGLLTIQRDKVERLLKTGSKGYFENPMPTRYILSPSAINLDAGENYYQNRYVFFNSVYMSITKHFSFVAGIETISTFSGTPVVLLSPKFATPLGGGFHAGIGSTIALVEGESGGLAFETLTKGSPDNNFSLNVGFFFAEGETSDLVYGISYVGRMSKRVAFVTDNFVAPDSFDDNFPGVFSYGLRFLGPRMQATLAFFNNRYIMEDLSIGIPYVDFAVRF